MATDDIKAVLAARIGLDPTTLGGDLLDRAMLARMVNLDVVDPAVYAGILRASEAEQDLLVEEVVVPESWFFRDVIPFRTFADHARTGWLDRPDRPPLRALSLPCAAGEEPYSLAIALIDLGLPARRWSIDAVDVSDRVLARALRGIYRENAFRGGDLAYRGRHFRAEGVTHVLDADVRSTVRFSRGNLLDPALLRGEAPFDVIFCRNVLIYFDPGSCRRALATLDALLARDGLLFLGHADSLAEAPRRYVQAGPRGSFAFRRASEIEAAAVDGKTPASRTAPAVDRRPIRDPKKSIEAREVSLPPIPPAPRPSLPPPPAPMPAPGLLDEASALAGRGLNGRAAELCERSIREAGPTAAAYFLLGMIRRAMGEPARAEEALTKAAYLDPGHDDALLALALIAENRGDLTAAAGYRRRAARAHQTRGAS